MERTNPSCIDPPKICLAGVGSFGEKASRVWLELASQVNSTCGFRVIDPDNSARESALEHIQNWGFRAEGYRYLQDVQDWSNTLLVYLATPSPQHTPQTIYCVNRGVPVILAEKPMAVNLRQLHMLEERLPTARSRVFCDYVEVASATMQGIIEYLKLHRRSCIKAMRFYRCNSAGHLHDIRRGLAGADVVEDKGVHCLSISHRLLLPQSYFVVQAYIYQLLRDGLAGTVWARVVYQTEKNLVPVEFYWSSLGIPHEWEREVEETVPQGRPIISKKILNVKRRKIIYTDLRWAVIDLGSEKLLLNFLSRPDEGIHAFVAREHNGNVCFLPLGGEGGLKRVFSAVLHVAGEDREDVSNVLLGVDEMLAVERCAQSIRESAMKGFAMQPVA